MVSFENRIFRKSFSFDQKFTPLTRKWFYAFIFTSKYFRKIERKLSERETRLRAEGEREREEEPRKLIVLDPDRRPWPRRWIVLDPDCRPRSRRTPKPIVLDPDHRPRSRSRLRTDRDRSTNRLRTISPLVEPSRDRIMNFFFLGFICVSGLRNEIIYLFGSWENLRKCEKMWVISRKCVFYGIFNNTTKHQKIFFTTFSEMQPNTLKIFSFPENNIFRK